MSDVNILKMLQQSYKDNLRGENKNDKCRTNATRITYTEEELMKIKSSSSCLKINKRLNKKFLENGIWNPIGWFDAINNQEELQFNRKKRQVVEDSLKSLLSLKNKTKESYEKEKEKVPIDEEDPAIIRTSDNEVTLDKEQNLLSFLKNSCNLKEFETDVKHKILHTDNFTKAKTLADVYGSIHDSSYIDDLTCNTYTSVTTTESVSNVDTFNNASYGTTEASHWFSTAKNVVGFDRNCEGDSTLPCKNTQITDTMNVVKEQGYLAQTNQSATSSTLGIIAEPTSLSDLAQQQQTNYLRNITSGFLSDSTKSTADHLCTLKNILLNQLQRQIFVTNYVTPTLLHNNQHQIAQLFTQKKNVPLLQQDIVSNNPMTP